MENTSRNGQYEFVVYKPLPRIMYFLCLLYLLTFIQVNNMVTGTNLLRNTQVNIPTTKQTNKYSFNSANKHVPHQVQTDSFIFDELFNDQDSASSAEELDPIPWQSSTLSPYISNIDEYQMSFTTEELLTKKVNHRISQDVDMDPCKSGKQMLRVQKK